MMTMRLLLVTGLVLYCACDQLNKSPKKANVENQYDPWPKETEKIEALTAERAAKLASLRPRGIYNLYLTGLKSIDKDVARELATFKGNLLSLRGLTSIDQEIARELSNFKGSRLNLDGLTSIDKDIAQELVTIQVHLDLNGLTSIDKQTALALAKWNGGFLKLGAESIDDDGETNSEGIFIRDGKGYLNLGIRWSATETLLLEVNVNDVLKNNTYTDAAGNDFNSMNREVKIIYFEQF